MRKLIHAALTFSMHQFRRMKVLFWFYSKILTIVKKIMRNVLVLKNFSVKKSSHKCFLFNEGRVSVLGEKFRRNPLARYRWMLSCILEFKNYWKIRDNKMFDYSLKTVIKWHKYRKVLLQIRIFEPFLIGDENLVNIFLEWDIFLLNDL